MKKLVTTFTILSIFAISLFAASGVGTTTLELKGSVGPKYFLDVTQSIGAVPGVNTSIPLDQGVIMPTEPGIGVNVGDWSVSSNTIANLILRISYTPFTATINDTFQSIAYQINNGTDWVSSGSPFIPLVRSGSLYKEIDNNGSIYLKRTDSDSYLPSVSYVSDITFTLETE